MWIVELALRRPYTFVVMAMLIAILGVFTILRMPTDIFPDIDIPVIAVLFNYSGISPEEMEGRIVSNYERILLSTVNDIEHVESQSLYGQSVTKVFLQPGSRVEMAVAQITATSQGVIRTMPPGIFPPLIMRYSATNVPILQASFSSDTIPEHKIFDLATSFIRPAMATIRGAQLVYPYGGKLREMVVDLDPEKLYAWKLSASDVSEAISRQNLILPAGTTKIGTYEYSVQLNSSPRALDQLNDLPIKTVAGKTIYVRDVAHVHDGFRPQTNIVHVNGKRSVLQSILKSSASTLEIAKSVKERLPKVMDTLPKELKVDLLADQSVFVRAAVSGVVKEAAIAAGLTGLMILLFLGSWRSTLIVIVSIPLSILVSIIVLNALHQSLNVMTLGGMALAVGILIDDATVEIENIHRNIAMKKKLVRAILDGASQIAVPAFVSTLCICIVFVPVIFITGAAKSLFMPMAMAVVFAMLTSYLLSRTLVPTMVHHLLAGEMDLYGGKEEEGVRHRDVSRGLIWHVHEGFNRGFEKLRSLYGAMLAWALGHRLFVLGAFIVFVVGSCSLFKLIGRDFFPSVDAGQIRLHVRAPAGTRIEETERWFGVVEDAIKEVLPANEVQTMLDNIGIPNSGINLALSDGSMISPADGEILISLKPEHHPTDAYIRGMREMLNRRFPELTFFFQPPDIVTQVLNFGLPAPIDIQIVGPKGNQAENMNVARRIREEVSEVPGAVDVHIFQVGNTPQLAVDVDRTVASELGITQRDVANDVLISLSSSGQVAPSFWLDYKTGVQYSVTVQTPQYKIDSLSALRNTPINSGEGEPQLLGNLASVAHATGATNLTHYDVARTIDVHAGVQGRDLGRVSKGVEKVIADIRKDLPRGSTITLRGQVESMNSSFRNLAYGLIFAVVLVYLLMVVNFQSWIDPLIILMALPGALCGILWMLFATGTTVNVPSLMGTIMSIGVATSNSILLITFANDQRHAGMNARDAAWSAGVTRIRPVIMTALAMIIGMLPMALGMGEGGEQNAPLGRAVIGGLAMATFATLFFVPIVYSTLRRTPPKPPVLTLREAE